MDAVNYGYNSRVSWSRVGAGSIVMYMPYGLAGSRMYKNAEVIKVNAKTVKVKTLWGGVEKEMTVKKSSIEGLITWVKKD